MRVPENMKHFSASIATLGALGWWPFGAFFGSAIAVPLMFLFRSIYWFNSFIFIWVVAFSSIFFLVIVQWAMQREIPISPHAIVLDKVAGVMMAFIGIPLRWRVLFFGFLLFHFINLVRPFEWYRKIVGMFEKLPGVLGIFAGDIFSGLVVNLFLRLIAWVMG